MKEKDLQAAIIELKNIFEDMKALFEWYKLKRFEAAQRLFSNLIFNDTTLYDLNNKYSTFLQLASRIYDDINSQDISKSKLKIVKKELKKIELQAFYLGSGINFY